jgi:hypothetical protein
VHVKPRKNMTDIQPHKEEEKIYIYKTRNSYLLCVCVLFSLLN